MAKNSKNKHEEILKDFHRKYEELLINTTVRTIPIQFGKKNQYTLLRKLWNNDMIESTRCCGVARHPTMEGEVFPTQYIPLKTRIEIFRRYAEILFDADDLERSVHISQQLDVLIHYMLLLRHNSTYVRYSRLTGKRHARRVSSRAC